MTVRDVIKVLEQDGWYLDRTRGSHRQFKHRRKPAAYSPDLDGCVATGRTREEVEREMQEAIAFHLEGMAQSGQPIPEPQTYSRYVGVSAPNR